MGVAQIGRIFQQPLGLGLVGVTVLFCFGMKILVVSLKRIGSWPVKLLIRLGQCRQFGCR